MDNSRKNILISLIVFFYIDHNLYRSGKIEDYVKVDDCYPKTWNNKIEYTIYDMYDYGIPKKYLQYLNF